MSTKQVMLALAMMLAAGACGTAAAQTLTLTRWTIDGGGATFSTGGVFELGGTIGQPDAGAMAGGPFELVGGFWPGAVAGGACGDCVGDVNQSGAVELADLSTLLSNFGTPSAATCAQGDIEPASGDGDVDLTDLAILLARFGTSCN
jgi:hypothetical protein